jgi:chemotaxis protein CheX
MALNFKVDEILINSMIDAAENGFKLGEKEVHCVSIGKCLPGILGNVTGIIGIAGRVNGSVMVSMSEHAALRLASSMLMEELTTFNDDALDALSEVTNVVGGRLKSSLGNSGYPLDNITLPSVIIGSNYFVSHTKGMLVFHIGLEIQDKELPLNTDRIAHLAMTLLTSDLSRKAT